MKASLALLVLVTTGPAFAADDGGWALVVQGPITVKNRALEGTPIKEIWAEGEIDAPAAEVEEALMDVPGLRSYMPYLKDARWLGEPLEDGTQHVYTLIDLPVVGKRDYVVRMGKKQSLATDGVFRNEWHAFPDYLPRRHGITRVTRNDGSWEITPRDDGKKCWAVYKFTVDPGGWIPAFAANLGNEKGVKETYDAVAREARRRAAMRSEPGAAAQP